jgi:hypothetical protein
MAEIITAKIQVRRGELLDLPVLDEGEFGYALDHHRLFIGNRPIEATADGQTKRFNISDRALIPGQLVVLVNDVEQAFTYNYTIEDTDVVFVTAPTTGSLIKISHNTELSIVNQRAVREIRELKDNCTDKKTGISWSLENYNTASIDYSLKSTSGSMAVGTLKMITDGTTLTVVDIGGTLGTTGITFDGKIENNRAHLIYTNATQNNANFSFNIQLWNTI